MYNSYSALNLLGGMLYTMILLVIAYFVLKIVANWKIFEKAGQPGWASIVPFYSNYIEFNIYWGNGWLFLIPVVLSLLSGIPLLGNLFLVVALIIGAITNYKKAVAFGEGIGFTIGLCLLNPVFNMILAFGHYEYHGIPQDGYSYSQLKTKYEEKKAEAMEVVALIDRFGYAKTIDKATFERNKEAALSESKYVISCMNTDKACIFTDTGRLHLIKITDMPFGRFRDKSIPLDNLGNYDSSGENIIHICNLASIQDSMMLFATKTGMLKLVKGSEFDVSKRTVAATKLADGDSIIAICTADNFNQLVLQTENGYFIRFPMMNIPEMKKTAIGVRGISLGSGDSVKAAYPLDSSQECTIIHNEKELLLNKLKLVNRGGKGTKVRI